MSEDVSNVTFVDGKAVSQEEPATGQAPANEREAAIAAVREALQKAKAEESQENEPKAAKKEPKEKAEAKLGKPAPVKQDEGEEGDSGKSDRDAQGRFLPKKDAGEPVRTKPFVPAPTKADKTTTEEDGEEAPKSEPLPDPKKATVTQLLKNREKLAKEKLAVKEEINAEREAFRKEQEELRNLQAQVQQERQFLQQQAQRLQALKSDPARAVREAGWEPEDFILRLAREGTPEGQADRQTMQMREELAQLKQWRQEQAQQAQHAQRAQEYQRLVDYRREVENQFLTTAVNEEKYPHISNFYKGREAALISEGDIIAAEFRQLSGGREASFSEVADYIEEELASRTKAYYSKTNANAQADASGTSGKPTKGNKGKTLSQGMASERRTLGTSQKNLDGEERLLAAREATKLAIAEARQAEE